VPSGLRSLTFDADRAPDLRLVPSGRRLSKSVKGVDR
jgi:hypothetical protein